MKLFRWIRRIVVMILVIGGVFGGVLAYQGYQMYREALDRADLSSQVEQIRAQPGYTSLEELPELYLNAVVAVEDHRFYQHGGIDLIAIGRALMNDLRAGAFVEGGSTITQQLAKNMYFTQEKSVIRKIAEVFMAFKLEQSYTKDELLELYVNHIYFGAGYYCVGDASRGYFDKEPGALTDAESTLLAGIPNAPSAYAPTSDPTLAAARQRQVLRQLVKLGYLTDEESETLAVEGWTASFMACA